MCALFFCILGLGERTDECEKTLGDFAAMLTPEANFLRWREKGEWTRAGVVQRVEAKDSDQVRARTAESAVTCAVWMKRSRKNCVRAPDHLMA